ncbi:LysR family transcriptional regulator [Nocardiopsis terrae]|uniref:DNA-binding transcriptional LysR family regulator n=1 Tax=Nocardiopsis terrae TaxID=372655 RepID=A0ABR9HHC2_9ACTN|nr:LysR substrate-binding domain-containing protein [Nocardiopsis terrae]MBE1458421.1 DNA-binding transcriptional LysR family regulator [Nocardiopsis terrae]GHC80576.1 LysR family transcriptional regulator [Nocardiopsis terrae]
MLERHDAYETFLRVAEAGSLTAAARSLGYTQSAVSRQVHTLEHDLGTALFDRLPRGVALTEAGHVLVPHAEAVVSRLAAARTDLEALRRLDGGRLRVGSFATADAALVPRAIAAFRTRHPRVHLSRDEGFTVDLLDRVQQGGLDLAVVSSPPDGARVRLSHLADEPVLVALPAGHPLAGRRGVRFAQLEGEEWIAGGERPENTLLAAAVRPGFRPRVAHVVREWIAKQGFVAAGLGVTLLPALAAASARPDIALAAMDPGELPHRGVYVALPADRRTAPATEAFLEELRAAARAVLAGAAT